MGEAYQGPFLPRPDSPCQQFIGVFRHLGFKLGSDRTRPFAPERATRTRLLFPVAIRPGTVTGRDEVDGWRPHEHLPIRERR